MIGRKKPDILRLARGMSVEDKANLIYADLHLRNDSGGLERLLTPEEERALIEDAKKEGQLPELNRINKLVWIACRLIVDMHIAYLHFDSIQKFIATLYFGRLLYNHFEDTLQELEWRTEGNVDVHDFINRKQKELHSVYGLIKLRLVKMPYDKTEKPTINRDAVACFSRLLDHISNFRQLDHMLRYIQSLHHIDLISPIDKQLLAKEKTKMEAFFQEDIWLMEVTGLHQFDDEQVRGTIQSIMDRSLFSDKNKRDAEEKVKDIVEQELGQL